MSRADDALMRLYESADLRDELTDEEAEKLLAWAEAELKRLDESGIDDAAFTQRADTLMDMLKHMNRFAGRQGQISAQDVNPAPAKIAAAAEMLDHPVSAEQIAAAATGDPLSTVEALTAMLSQPTAAAGTQDAPPDSALPPEMTGAPAAPTAPAAADDPAAPALEPETPPSDPLDTFGDTFDNYIDL